MEEVLVHPCMVHFEHDPQICAKCSSPRVEFGSLHAVGFQSRGQKLLNRVFPECSDFAVRERALQVEPSYIDCFNRRFPDGRFIRPRSAVSLRNRSRSV
jgi:hypothetical protein